MWVESIKNISSTELLLISSLNPSDFFFSGLFIWGRMITIIYLLYGVLNN